MPRGSSIELAREMVNEVDKNNDGRVDYNEVGVGSRLALALMHLSAATTCLRYLMPRLMILVLPFSVSYLNAIAFANCIFLACAAVPGYDAVIAAFIAGPLLEQAAIPLTF